MSTWIHFKKQYQWILGAIYLAALDLSCDILDLLLRHRISLAVAHGHPSMQSSVVAACGLCWTEACGILVPQLRVEPMSPPLQGVFLITGLPRKSSKAIFERCLKPKHQYVVLTGTHKHSKCRKTFVGLPTNTLTRVTTMLAWDFSHIHNRSHSKSAMQ